MRLTDKIAISAVSSVLIKFLLAGFTFKYGTSSITSGGIDGLVVAAILTPCLGSAHLETYISKRKTHDDES